MVRFAGLTSLKWYTINYYSLYRNVHHFHFYRPTHYYICFLLTSFFYSIIISNQVESHISFVDIYIDSTMTITIYKQHNNWWLNTQQLNNKLSVLSYNNIYKQNTYKVMWIKNHMFTLHGKRLRFTKYLYKYKNIYNYILLPYICIFLLKCCVVNMREYIVRTYFNNTQHI